MNIQRRLALILPLFLLWIVLASAGLFYFGNQHYGAFAGDSDWLGSAPVDFNLSALNIKPAEGVQVVHVQQQKCICNSRAQQHIALFSSDYQVPAAAQYHRDIADVIEAGFSLPASPAVLIFDHGQLIYAGPYATGPLCSAADSLIAPILLNQVQLPGLWLNGDAKACRCVIEPETLSSALYSAL